MSKVVFSYIVMAFCIAGAATAAVEEGAAAGAGGQDQALEEFLRAIDERAESLETLEAGLTYTRRENFSGRTSVSTGRVYVRKPSDMFIEFTEPYPRRIWIRTDQIVDYKVDLNSAEVVELAPDKNPEIIGLSTRFLELQENFHMTLGPEDDQRPSRRVLTLVPAEDVEADFTTAEVEIDTERLLPVSVTEKDGRLDVDKIFAFSDIRENPRLRAALFTPSLRRDTDVTVHELGDWTGP